jgi:predicted HNH restriction endonuclease
MSGNQYSNAPGWSPTTKQCEICSKEFRIKPCNVKKSKYCSKECFYKSRKGRKLSSDHVAKIAASNTGQKRSLEFRINQSRDKMGEKNPQWKGGKSKHPKYSVLSSEIRRYGMTKKEALKVLGDKCNQCGMSNKESLERWGRNLVIHHIDGNGRNTNRPNNKLENLEIICSICHGKTHLTRDKALAMRQKQIDNERPQLPQ